ncbi:MAG: glycosyltransferase family 2 protein [Pseudarcicella sp.]|nr:glycosyltransferase family 2 protein [Pseudarcicella sp.]MBP6410298.1 glycosyltransferase family 2 protein [Pseudarcicella sp.]
MKLSVTVQTYNHEKYIAQTLESVVNQVVDFEFEVLVGDDASTDRTPQIILEYQQKYPHLIKPLLHPKNLGGFAKNNVIATLALAKGKYIAAMDGDDYWVDNTKLQQQVDILDKHPEHVACFHNARIVFDDNSHPDMFVNDDNQKIITTVDDLVGEDEVWYMATSAVVFRNGIINHYPKWFHESKSGDIPRYILLGKNGGSFYYINKVMSVYRKNNGGMSFTDSKQDAGFLINRIGMYNGIDLELGYKYHHRVRKNTARYYLMLANSIQYCNNPFMSRFYAMKSLYLSRKNTNEHFKNVMQDYIIPKWMMDFYANTKQLIFK